MDQEIDQKNPPRFNDEPVSISNNNHETDEPVLNGFNRDDNDDHHDHDHVKENGNSDSTQLPAIPPVSTGQGFPYAPVDFPSPGDVWTWKVGRRVTNTGMHKDRFLILPERLKTKTAPKYFAGKNPLYRYLVANFSDVDVNAFFASFTWNIPALFQPANKVVLFEETAKEGQNQDENAEDGKVEGTSSRYSQRKRKQVYSQQTNEQPKATPRASNRRKTVTTTTPATKQNPSRQSSSSRRSTREQQADVVELDEEDENRDVKRIKKRRVNFADEKEEASIPHIYVSPMNGVISVSHPPVDVNPEEFDNYLNSLDNLLQQQPSEARHESSSSSSSLPVSLTSPTREHEWGEARKKLASLLDKDFSVLFMSNEAEEIATLAAKLRKDPSLTAEELVRLKLIEEMPTFSEVFQENKCVIEQANRFFSALELNKAKVASLKYEYSDLKDKLGNIQTEVDASTESICEIDKQIAQLQARRTELTRCISNKEKEKVDLSFGQKMVANSIPKVVQDVQAANSKKPDWELKKDNAIKREAEILNKFSILKGFFF